MALSKTPPVPMDEFELRLYQQETLLNDDDYTTELRLHVVHYGETLLNRVRYEVELLEKELVALSSVFNEFLDEVKTMDAKIGKLSTAINQGKMQAAKELDQTIKQEVQNVVEQLRVLPKADLDGVEMLFQNLDALQDNYGMIQAQIKTLDEIGVKTEHLKKNLPALEKGLNQFGKSIEERQMSLLVGEEEDKAPEIDYDELRQELMSTLLNQRRAMINHLRQAQTMANPKEVELLKRNQQSFEQGFAQISEQIKLLEEAGQNITELQEQLEPVASGLRQFERALASNQFLAFSQKIYDEVAIVNEQIEEAQACDNFDDLEILRENVEALFENCDAMADELDVLADQGLDIDPVIEHYDVLRMAIEQFERMVQEAANRIGLASGRL
ncbi:MAG: hypothetical protein IGS03_06175 [Candidatus Sericytochromatia bacterium]|nr:hypothetical protein [Candidatus Sericytochromatia bacterium]